MSQIPRSHYMPPPSRSGSYTPNSLKRSYGAYADGEEVEQFTYRPAPSAPRYSSRVGPQSATYNAMRMSRSNGMLPTPDMSPAPPSSNFNFRYDYSRHSPASPAMSACSVTIGEAMGKVGERVSRAGSDSSMTSTSISHMAHKFPKYEFGLTYKDFQIGDIVWGPWVTSCLNGRALDSGDEKALNNFAWTESTGPIVGKMKPMVVYSIYRTHMLAFPINTSGRNGLTNKNAYLKSLSLLLVNHDDQTALAACGINYFRAAKGYKAPAGSYIDLTRPYVLELQYPLRWGGSLTKMSRRRLEAFAPAYYDKGREPIPLHANNQHPRIRQASQLLSAQQEDDQYRKMSVGEPASPRAPSRMSFSRSQGHLP